MHFHPRHRAFTLVELPAASSGKRKAFTLVELLVVIGIIAVLIGILLPALNRARDSAYTLKCLANLKQIGTGVVMYASETRGFLPYARDTVVVPLGPQIDYYDGDKVSGGSDLKVYWVNTVAPYLDRSLHRPFAAWGGKANSPPGATLASKGKWVFWCPKDINDAIATEERWRDWASYSSNFYVAGDKGGNDTNGAIVPRALKMSQLKRSSEIIYIHDGPIISGTLASSGKDLNGAAFPVSNPPNAVDFIAGYRISRRHANKKAMNALFCDGHAETLLGPVSDQALKGNGQTTKRDSALDRMLIPPGWKPANAP